MTSPGDSLASAIQHHQAGDLQNAERIYRAILAEQPRHADALHLLGLIALQVGQHQQACQLIGQAIEVNGNAAAFHSNLGIALMNLGRATEAIAAYRRAVALKPDYAEAYSNLGAALRAEGELDEAATACQKALSHNPNYAEAHYNLGITRHSQGELEAAIVSCQRALQLKPQFPNALFILGVSLGESGESDAAIQHLRRLIELEPRRVEAYNQLAIALRTQGNDAEALRVCETAIALDRDCAEVHNTLGTVLKSQERLDEAILAYKEALRCQPAFSEAHNNLGVALQLQGRFDEAADACRQAIQANPKSGDAYNNLGFTLDRLGDLEAATLAYQEGLRLKPDSSETHNNFGAVLQTQGQLEEAKKEYRHALHLNPDSSEAHKNLGFAMLATGDFERGWDEYEWRWQTRDYESRELPQPIWDGSPLRGRTILVHAEQGLGDTIQFVRYLPLVKQRGGRVLFECQPPLLRLLENVAGIDGLIPRGKELPKLDLRVPLMSLPRLFRTRLGSIPAGIPYLFADPARVAHWKDRLKTCSGLKVGVVWQGNRTFPRDLFRSIPFRHFASLSKVPGVSLISLQKGDAAQQLDELGEPTSVLDLNSELQDFVDTAGVMLNLDLFVTSDTAVAHLAGALGIPIWLATQYAPDWRWMQDREDSPWYPTMRLFRQPTFGNWDAVFERIALALRNQRPVIPQPHISLEASNARQRV